MAKHDPKPKHHHFLPQFLQRGFTSRTNGDRCWVWEFRGGQGPAERRVQEVGGARYFHDDPDKSSLEYRLSDLETKFGAVAIRLRSGQSNEADLLEAPQLVNHLLVRTKNVRDAFGEALDEGFKMLGEGLKSGEYDKRLHRELVAEIKKRLTAVPQFTSLIPRQRKFKMRMVENYVSAYLKGRDFRGQLADYVDGLLASMDVKKMIKQAHNRSLENALPASFRTERFQGLKWTVHQYPLDNLILGDAAVLGADQLNGSLQNVLALNRLQFVCLPLGTHTLLVGHKQTHPILNIETINQTSAALSRDFFIASRCTETERDYAKLIGTRAELVTEADKKRAFGGGL